MTETPMRNFINPPTIAAPPGYTHVVETSGGRTVYLAGQVGFAPDGSVVGAGDAGQQAEQAFANLAAGLEAVGGSFSDVVKLTIFMLDIADFGAIQEARDKYINQSRSKPWRSLPTKNSRWSRITRTRRQPSQGATG